MHLSADFAFCAAVAALLPACFRWPWVGVLVWSWLGFMNPHRLVGGMAVEARLSLVVALTTLAGLPFTTTRFALPRTREVFLLGAFWLVTIASTFVAPLRPEVARGEFVEVTKILLMNGLLVMVLFQDRLRIEALVWVTVVSLGFHAVCGSAWALATHATEPLYGPPDSQIYDNNNLAAALVLLLPLVAFLHRHATRIAVKLGLAVVYVATVVAIQATFSRAGLIGLVLVLGAMAWSRYFRMVAVAAATVALLLFSQHASTAWTERMATILAVEETAHHDDSAVTRLNAWFVALRLGQDHPVLGAGYAPFSPPVYEHYIPGYSDYHNAHNLFLQVFAEHGFPGLLLYAALLACTWATLHRVSTKPSKGPDDPWLADCARAVEIAMIGYAAVSMFHCLSYKDLLLQCVSLAVVLDVVSQGAPPPAAPLLRFWKRA